MLRKIKLLIGISFIISGLYLTIKDIYNYSISQVEETLKIEEFFSLENPSLTVAKSYNDYYSLVLEIPKINLKKGLYHPNSEKNNVNKNILVVKESQMPDTKNSNLILASHSGNSNASYFKKLDELSVGDIIYIYYNERKYTYSVRNIEEIIKNGYLEIVPNPTDNTLILVTCKPNTTDKQIVVQSILQNISTY